MKTALHWAAKHGNTQTVNMLCNRPEINVNARAVSCNVIDDVIYPELKF